MERRQYELDRKASSYKQEKDRYNANKIQSSTEKYFKKSSDQYMRKERYDPFAFQSTPRPKVRTPPTCGMPATYPGHLDTCYGVTPRDRSGGATLHLRHTGPTLASPSR